jgi:phospholipid transport system substrate-binding protein
VRLRYLRVFRAAALALGACFWAAAAVAQPPAAASEPVDALHEVLLEGMKRADELGVKGRYALFDPVIAARFELRLMAAITVGAHWQKAGAEERERLVEAFRRYSVGTYASRFDSFGGERFEIVGTRDGPRETAMVDTRIVIPADSPVPISYVLRRFEDEWRIVDVLVDAGISELAVKRSEYRSVLARGGIDALVAELNNRADRLVSE